MCFGKSKNASLLPFFFVLCTPLSLFAQTTLETLKCPAFIEKSLSSIRSQLNCTCSFSDTISSLQARVSSLSANIKKLVEHPPSLLFPSCQAVLSKWPKSPSGYYSIVDEDEQTRQVYCHMGAMCGKGGGWMRVANLNMKEESNHCPSGFRLFSTNGVRACGRPYSNGRSCVSTYFSSRSVKYTQVCGKVIGYQVGTPDATHNTAGIDSYYVDGVSLTHGSSPRKHIWTLISGHDDRGSRHFCPCSSGSTKSAPSFVKNDYYCEAGSWDIYTTFQILYSSDPLWDGKSCGSSEIGCCKPSLLPWFYKTLGYATMDSIEMRICLDQNSYDEDVAVGQYEIYIK